MPKPSRPVMVLVMCAVWALLTAFSFRTPTLSEGGADRFSGTRALETLRRLLPDDQPHPLGSDAQDAGQGRLEAELQRLGLRPESSEAWACSPWGQCGRVRNLLVEFPGEVDDAVLFVAHTDSAMAGPGAGDDQHAVAILVELAREFATSGRRPRNSVIFLFTDGEEEGLLGASSFVQRDPRAARVAAAVNLEARGNAGISMLFQTLGEDAWLIDAYASQARRPYCSSMAQAVYEMMPHYTDLSALHAFGIPGVDFAFIDGESAYHSPLDTVDALDPGSLQSQGDNARAMLRALENADLRSPKRGYASWFDVLGLFVVRVPRGVVFPFAGLFALATLIGTWRARRQGRLRAREALGGFGLVLGVLVACGFLAWGLIAAGTAVKGEPRLGVAHPYPLFVALLLLPGPAYLLAARVPLGELALRWGTLLFLALVSLPVALIAPGAAYLFLVPASFWLISELLTRDETSPVPQLIAGSLSLIVWLPVLHGLRLALGNGPALSVCACLAGLPFWILLREAPARSPLVAGLVTLTLAVTGLALPTHDPDHPKRQWLSAVTDGENTRVYRGPGPAVEPGLRVYGNELPTEVELPTTPPLIDQLKIGPPDRKERRWLSFRILSPRGAPTVVLSIPRGARLHELHIEDTGPPRGFGKDGDVRLELHNLPPEGVRLRALVERPSVAWRIADRSAWPDPPDLLEADARSSWDGATHWVVRDFEPNRLPAEVREELSR